MYIQLQVLSTNIVACFYRGWDGTWFHLIHDSSKHQYQLTIPEAVCTVMCSWWWAEEPPETYRASVETNNSRNVASWWCNLGKYSLCFWLSFLRKVSFLRTYQCITLGHIYPLSKCQFWWNLNFLDRFSKNLQMWKSVHWEPSSFMQNFMFCWPCILVYLANRTNLVHKFS